MAKSTRNYTIQGVPSELDRDFCAKAKQCNQSLNRVVLDELTGTTVDKPVKCDTSDLVAKWGSDPEFDAIIASQRVVDPEKWR
jgi:protein-L-isoaspartate O-methyltransferase